MTAKIKVSDSIGTRTIIGKWSTEKTKNYKKVIEPNIKSIVGQNTKIEPGVILEYLRNAKGMNIISFSKEITDEGLILKTGKTIFEKK
ncbi:hypothetical protein [Flavivirga rizhaonensis]|uniref:Uncharacterized protein n=1 Tax=Flavivirga rizhaonensis TaxID=2559571 RepID=A0A4S1DXU1_9FLAO|nr:hypothetical protein [Flavivirga rizhaonensis]TGV02765.1 hypothetical protein EM932_10065 [Flavivirga rizhaonensis]